jgi:stage II sporulation protein M
MFSRSALLASWKDVRPYFIFSVILFFAAVIVGTAPGSMDQVLLEQMKGIAELAEKAQKNENPQLSMFWIIFQNNITAAVMTMYLGIAAGIFPLLSMIMNGMVIGFMFGQIADTGVSIFPLIVKGILPHGIIELPALFLASGYGMLLGVGVWKGVFGSLLGKREAWHLFKRTLKATVPALLVLVVALLAAALIESTVTYRLMT